MPPIRPLAETGVRELGTERPGRHVRGRRANHTQRVNGFAQVVFKDTGGGISDEVMQKLFEPLFTTKTKGTGLGLSVCQQVVNKHGGEISVVNREGEGATFTVQLPINREKPLGAKA